MPIICLPAFRDNYLWLYVSDDEQQVIVVDPGDANVVLDYLHAHTLKLTHIFITHHHSDHVGGISNLKKQFPDIRIYGPNNIAEITHVVSDAETIICAEKKWEILAVPGHTENHIAYYSPPFLFCGDTLFAGGCGRILGGTATQLFSSLQKIWHLPDNTEIYCAHEYTESNLNFALMVDPNNVELMARIKIVQHQRRQLKATVPSLLKIEKQTNPFLRCDKPAIRTRVNTHFQKDFSSALEVFTALRLWKDVQ